MKLGNGLGKISDLRHDCIFHMTLPDGVSAIKTEVSHPTAALAEYSNLLCKSLDMIFMQLSENNL